MIVDSDGVMVTLRGKKGVPGLQERLATLSARMVANELLLCCGEDTRLVGVQVTKKVGVTVHGKTRPAFDQGNQAAAWLSERLGGTYRLVMADATNAVCDQRLGGGMSRIRFQDGAQIMMIDRAAVEELSELIDDPEMPPEELVRRFRPNLVIGGSDVEAHALDSCHGVWIGDAYFENTGPCERCPIPRVAGDGSMGPEPDKTLATFRRGRHIVNALPEPLRAGVKAAKVHFGTNFVRTSGREFVVRGRMPVHLVFPS